MTAGHVSRTRDPSTVTILGECGSLGLTVSILLLQYARTQLQPLVFDHNKMVFLLARRLRDKFWPEPLPPPGSFEGQTVLVTGATAGLGLAAAVHFARLNARVIITSRTASQGEAAVESIAQQAGISKQGQLYFVELDMSRYSSCVSFVERLKQHAACERGLDVAVLNAGLINVDFVRSPEGWYILPFPVLYLPHTHTHSHTILILQIA